MNIIEDESALLEELLNSTNPVSINKCREVLIELLKSETLPAQLLLEPIQLLIRAKENVFETYYFDDEISEISNLEIDW
uniref:hypothetical protein n=1 Tax=Salmonella sp. ZJHZ20_0162 TaxID=3159595 RepID=UPI00397E24C2